MTKPLKPSQALAAKALGAHLRSIRTERGLTVVETCRRVGMARAYLSMIETGKTGTPSEHIIHRLAGALGVDSDELLTLAGITPTLPPVDVCAFLMANPEQVALLRTLAGAQSTPDKAAS